MLSLSLLPNGLILARHAGSGLTGLFTLAGEPHGGDLAAHLPALCREQIRRTFPQLAVSETLVAVSL